MKKLLHTSLQHNTYKLVRGLAPIIRTRLTLLCLLMMVAGQSFAGDTDYYAKLTATTSATGKGLVYAATSNTAPTADNQYKTSVTANKGKQTNTQSFTYYAWAKPARGYLFNGWTGSSATVGSNPTGSGDAITVSGSTDSNSPTDGKVTANWKDATAYTVTYKQPENNGQYSVRYDYTTIANNAFTAGSETYTMSSSSADKAVKSYAADKVTLSTSLSSFIGWYEGDTQLSTDKTYVYTITKNATITARFEAPKEYQASVTSNGTTTQYKTIQEALAAANKLTTNPTITLLDNITGVDEILTISKSMTLDLNGYTLSGKGGRRAPNSTSDLSKELLFINGSKITVTIKDGSTAKSGTISCTDELNHDLYAVRMDNGTLNLESGTIHCENTAKYSNSSNRMRTYSVYAAPGCTLNQKGATIEAIADYYAYGILTGGWYSGNGPATVNVSGGTINSSAYNSPRGLEVGYANANVTGGTIIANATGGNWSSYGINLNAGANVQKKDEWHATLKMSGGTVKATSTTSAARGIRVNRAVAYESGTNTVASIVRAEATISGGTVEATTTTSWPVGVEPYGPTTISGGTITAKATTSDAYGVRVMDGKTIINGNANITATAQTNNAFGATAGADTDGYKGTPCEGELQVDGGTITATATTGATARGIFVQSASRQITNTASGYFPGYYAAAGKATINGGKISASSNGAAAFFISGTSTNGTASATPTASITGGWFKASGTNAACVNNAASTKDFTITGGDYQQNSYISDYVPSSKTVYGLTSGDAYNFGCRYYVTDWDYTKAIAKNISTNKTYTSVKTALDEATSEQTIVITENCKFDEQATVKNGVTLLVPYNSDYTSETTKPTVTQTWTGLSAFKTLNMTEGASLTVNNGGAICVAGQMYSTSNRMTTSTGGPGTPTGAFGCINMKEGGKITLQSGAKLYAWGFITGQNKDEGNNTTGVGTIDAQNGSVVYESFVIADWHGGSATSGFDTNKKFFPFNQYFIPNIEVPLTINYGATLNTYCNLSAGLGNNKTPRDVPINNFIAKSDGLFNLSSDGAYIKTWYDATTDEEHFDFSGNITVGSLSVNLAGYLTVNSMSYVMPLTSNMNMHIKNGTFTAPYDLALLPCSKVLVEEGASANLNANLYAYDLDDWDAYSYTYQRVCYPFRPTAHYTPTTDWTKKTGMTDAKLQVDGTVNVSGSMYTTTNGADICSTGYGQIKLTKAPTATATTYQVKGTDTETEVSVTAAQLHNADGSYVATSGATANAIYYYDPNEGKWATTEPAAPSFSLSKTQVKLDKAYLLTKGVTAKFAQNLKSFAKDKTVLSADLTKATGSFDVSAMRTAIGATDDNNVLLYAPATATADNINNVVIDGKCANFVITDKQPIDVPTAFMATNVSYSREMSPYKWGTICLPFELTSGNDIQYYELENIKGSQMTFTPVPTVEANTPAVYSIEGSDVNIKSSNVTIAKSGSTELSSDDFTLVGVQTENKTLPVSNKSPYYYIAQDKFWQPTKNAVTVRPQRAYFKTKGSESLAKVFSIGIAEDGGTTGIDSTPWDGNEPTVVGIYTVDGMRLNSLQPGINILKMSDGTTKKVIIKNK